MQRCGVPLELAAHGTVGRCAVIERVTLTRAVRPSCHLRRAWEVERNDYAGCAFERVDRAKCFGGSHDGELEVELIANLDGAPNVVLAIRGKERRQRTTHDGHERIQVGVVRGTVHSAGPRAIPLLQLRVVTSVVQRLTLV